MSIEKKAKQFAIEFGYKGCHYDTDWNGYKVFKPDDDDEDGACVGYPLIILTNENEVRISTPEEALQYLDFRYPGEDTEDDDEDDYLDDENNTTEDNS